MTPKFIVKSIIGAHFENKFNEGRGASMEKSYEEIKKILSLMKLDRDVPVLKGATRPLKDEETPEMSEGAQGIIEEALSDDPTPLYAAFMGTLTDLASAYLHEPKIAERLNVVWIGGGQWPSGGREFNLGNDISAANVVFSSDLKLWHIPKDVYRMIRVTLSELQYKVRPCGAIGTYLFQQMVDYNNENEYHNMEPQFPMGESWVLGDSPIIGALIEDHQFNYDWKPAPRVTRDMFFIHQQNNRPIRVYKHIDARMTLEDFFCKLAMNYPP